MKLALRALLSGAATFWPLLAAAHSPVPGLGRFYNGMLHPVLAPAALIALTALGVLIGQQGLVRTRTPVLGLLVALALGLLAGSQWPEHLAGVDTDLVLIALGLAIAACALAAWAPPATVLLLLASTAGAVAGLGLSDMAVAAGVGRWVVIAGTWLGAALLTLGVAAVAELASQPWQQVGLRVLASWLAASALLVLGLQWAGPLPAR